MKNKLSQQTALTYHKSDGFFDTDTSILEGFTEPQYIMGVDTVDKDVNVYCLGKKVGGTFEIILTKTMYNKEEFNQEVENLTKYFNACKLISNGI